MGVISRGERPAFERQRPTDREEILQRRRHLVRPVRVQAVVPHTNAQTGGNPVEEDRSGESCPTEHEKSGNGAQMQKGQHNRRKPVHPLAVINVEVVGGH